jgi:nitrile hydratase subunit beta
MNGGQDLGGAHGHGPVVVEPDEPLFHAPWERRALGLTIAAGGTGAWTIDMSRRAREDRPPAEYLTTPYYGLWIKGVERLVVETGLCTAEEVAAGHALAPPARVARVLTADRVPAALAAGGPTARPVADPPRFAIGDRVRTRAMAPASHTRLPRYARRRTGTIVRQHGGHVFPDTNAHGRGEAPVHLYTVRFAAAELWGPDTTAAAVMVDCFEPYLEPAP